MEASYCYIANEDKEAETINETTNLEKTQDECENSETSHSSSSDKTNESKNGELVESFNGTTNIHDLKKNLCNEEEFRSINHSEPIHIFLKLKPLSDHEKALQNNTVNTKLNLFNN